MSPADSMPLDYKWQGVPFPPDFRAMLPHYRDLTVGVSLGARGYSTSRCVQRHGSHAYSISIGRLGEKYYLMIVIDGIDFLWSQTCQTRTHPEDLLHEFLTMSRLKISTIRFDGASEFGKSSSFIAYCTQHDTVREPLASYTFYWVYYESIKRDPKIRGIYECRCDERLQTKTKEFTRLPYTGLVLELEHLKIETRLMSERCANRRPI